ncbi:MAG: ABC transporter ATP-binding protein [Fusobacteriaceae bacterium]|nr:ABC transporter ATP-binding protein [Fusobacteriaceae bacterium]
MKIKQKPLNILLNISKQGKKRLTVAGILIMISSFCAIGPFYIAYLIIDRLITPNGRELEFYKLGWIAGGLILGQMIFSGLAMKQSHIAAFNILFDLRVKFARKLMKLPLGYFSKTSSGVIKKLMMEDIESIEGFIAHNIVDFTSAIFIPLFIFGWLCTFNILLAVLCVFPVILGVVLQRLRMIRDEKEIKEFFKLKKAMNATIIDFIRGMPVIKAFNQTVHSFKKYKSESEKFSEHWIRRTERGGWFIAIYSLLMDGGVIFVIPTAAYTYLKGNITVTTFVMFMFIGLGITRFMKQLTSFSSNIAQILKAVEELDHVLNMEEIENNGKHEVKGNYDLEFSNVSFGYENEMVLKNINFNAFQGTVTALVGPSGAGKTTVGRLIPRFWDVSDGLIKINGINIKNIKAEELIKSVSFVFQDVFMFNDTILENIRMGDKNISREDVIKIAGKAQAHEFISKLPQGYDTVIGKKGVYLSGGEQQRISIARALAKNSPIIILDEATSYADVENEEKIQKALNNLLKNKTVIIIAHRLSTIKNSDQILVFNDGKIIEEGKHEQLLALNGQYKKMWDMHLDAADWTISSRIKESGVMA